MSFYGAVSSLSTRCSFSLCVPCSTTTAAATTTDTTINHWTLACLCCSLSTNEAHWKISPLRGVFVWRALMEAQRTRGGKRKRRNYRLPHCARRKNLHVLEESTLCGSATCMTQKRDRAEQILFLTQQRSLSRMCRINRRVCHSTRPCPAAPARPRMKHQDRSIPYGTPSITNIATQGRFPTSTSR